MREGWPGQEAVLCLECGRALAGGRPLYVRRGTGACLGCARDVQALPLLPCARCAWARWAAGLGEVPLYTAHGCDFVLGWALCGRARGRLAGAAGRGGGRMLNEGFILLHRSMLRWEWYGDGNTARLFIHLLLTVNYRPSTGAA